MNTRTSIWRSSIPTSSTQQGKQQIQMKEHGVLLSSSAQLVPHIFCTHLNTISRVKNQTFPHAIFNMQFAHSDPLLEANRLQNSCKLFQWTSPSMFDLLLLMSPVLPLHYLTLHYLLWAIQKFSSSLGKINSLAETSFSTVIFHRNVKSKITFNITFPKSYS